MYFKDGQIGDERGSWGWCGHIKRIYNVLISRPVVMRGWPVPVKWCPGNVFKGNMLNGCLLSRTLNILDAQDRGRNMLPVRTDEAWHHSLYKEVHLSWHLRLVKQESLIGSTLPVLFYLWKDWSTDKITCLLAMGFSPNQLNSLINVSLLLLR